jgi:hypothetical protein
MSTPAIVAMVADESDWLTSIDPFFRIFHPQDPLKT